MLDRNRDSSPVCFDLSLVRHSDSRTLPDFVGLREGTSMGRGKGVCCLARDIVSGSSVSSEKTSTLSLLPDGAFDTESGEPPAFSLRPFFELLTLSGRTGLVSGDIGGLTGLVNGDIDGLTGLVKGENRGRRACANGERTCLARL